MNKGNRITTSSSPGLKTQGTSCRLSLKQKICILMLIKEEVLQIRQLIGDSVNILKIAEMFNQSIQCIENVKNNKSYVNV